MRQHQIYLCKPPRTTLLSHAPVATTTAYDPAKHHILMEREKNKNNKRRSIWYRGATKLTNQFQKQNEWVKWKEDKKRKGKRLLNHLANEKSRRREEWKNEKRNEGNEKKEGYIASFCIIF